MWAYAWPVGGETDTSDNTLTDGIVYVGIPGDVNSDGGVFIDDIAAIARAFGSSIGDPLYEPEYDITNDGQILIDDVSIAARNFGKTDP